MAHVSSIVALRVVLISIFVFEWSRQMALNHRISFSIQEEVPNGTLIGNLPVSMRFEARYTAQVLAVLRYRFFTPPPGFLAIEETTGRILTKGRVDRETLCPHELLCKMQHDVVIQPEQYFQIIKVTIEVLDINDNRPEFHPAQMVHRMSESSLPGTTVVIPTAKDADTHNYSVQSYAIVASDPNDVIMEVVVQKKLDGSTEVRVVLLRPLDRESRDLHRFRVVAFDGGLPPRNGSLDVSVVVLDANDNSPDFEQASYEARVSENVKLFTTVVRVVAHDNDLGLNGEVTYGFGASTRRTYGDVFAVNNRSGEIYVIGEVDHELNPTCHLIVAAVDRGSESLSTEVTVTIKVEDANDNAPHLTVNTLYDSDTDVAQVMETVEIGSFVGHVIGRDPDKGQNGRFNCTVDEPHFRLRQIDTEEYHIVTSAPLDREQTARFKVTLVCQDGGRPPLTSDKTLIVDVLDVNDNPPRFANNNYRATVVENNLIDAKLVQIQAIDNDAAENGNVSYQLTGNGSTYFDVGRHSGVISAKVRFDHEQTQEFRMTLYAFDGGMPRLNGSVPVVIRILDANDETPTFTEPSYTFRVFENRPPGTEVGTVTAKDADDFPFNQFYYHLQSSKDEKTLDAFGVDQSTGKIKTKVKLDREERPVHRMLVVARDNNSHSLAGTATVTVQVMDVNDNAPRFLFPTMQNGSVVLNEPVKRGQVLTSIVCRDNDLELYGEVEYSITRGAGHHLFDINPKTGVITATEGISLPDSTADNRTFTLSLMARDRGEVPHKTFATLHIIVRRYEPGQSRGFLFGSVIFSDRNLPALAAICSTSGILIALLLAAIIVVGCRQRGSRDPDTCSSPDHQQHQQRHHQHQQQQPGDRVQAVRDVECLSARLTDSPGSKSNAMLIASTDAAIRYWGSPQHHHGNHLSNHHSNHHSNQQSLFSDLRCSLPVGDDGIRTIEVRLLENGKTQSHAFGS